MVSLLHTIRLSLDVLSRKTYTLSTDNLSKNLKRLYKILLNDNCQELTATSLEKVWALSIIEYHNYSKSIFIYLMLFKFH